MLVPSKSLASSDVFFVGDAFDAEAPQSFLPRRSREVVRLARICARTDRRCASKHRAQARHAKQDFSNLWRFQARVTVFRAPLRGADLSLTLDESFQTKWKGLSETKPRMKRPEYTRAYALALRSLLVRSDVRVNFVFPKKKKNKKREK